ncbi:hypothetical protein ACF0H5_022842 [Mactra antiquata]
MEFMAPEEEAKLIAEFNKRFPYKVELHVHLDGAVRPETVIDIAKERGMLESLPHKNVDEFNRDVIVTKPSSLEIMLRSFGYFMPIISGYKNAVSRIAYEICEDCAKHKIKYMEVRYSPHLFASSVTDPEFEQTPGSFTPRDVVQTVNEGLARGMKEFDVKVNSILCCMTNRPDWSKEVLELCKEFKDQGVVAIDIAGQEFEPGKHYDDCEMKKVFREAAKCGIHRTVHAGEIGTAKAVQEALDDMLAERIGHGYHSIEDPDLYQRIIRDQVHLEACPISSIMTKACEEDHMKHPLREFVKHGVNYSINTDDPVVLGNTLTDDYKFAQDMGLTDNDIIRGIFNAARSCFASDEDKKKIIKELTKIYGPH